MRAGAPAEQIREAIVKAEVREAVAQQIGIHLAQTAKLFTEPAAPEVTDGKLAELDKAALERYRLKDRPFQHQWAKITRYGTFAATSCALLNPSQRRPEKLPLHNCLSL
jgi:hypothetical protein